MRGVSVCNIWTDVKFPWFYLTFTGGPRVWLLAWANDAPGVRLGYQEGTLSWRTCFFRHSKGPSSEPQPPWFYSFTVATICSSCIRTFLSIFAETMSPTVFWFSGCFRRNHIADVFGLFCQNHVADLFIYLFLMTILAMETTQENFYYS